MKLTLQEDFHPWWNMKKYKNQDIDAKQFSDVQVKRKWPGNKGWPGPEKDVMYWVELVNGYAVGFRHGKGAGGRRTKYAEFPFYPMKEQELLF
jgi:hypothetical protein